MSGSKYVIRWKSKVNGRAGRGSKCFDRIEAERLAQELNREYPQIEHEAVKLTAEMAQKATVVEDQAEESMALTE
jgi:hypothetical protein